MISRLRHVIYGAVVAHFLRAIWRRMILAEQEPWEPPT